MGQQKTRKIKGLKGCLKRMAFFCVKKNQKQMADYLVKEVENKRWIWFKKANTYLQLEEEAFLVFDKIQKSTILPIEWCAKKFNISVEEASESVNAINEITTEELTREPQERNKLAEGIRAETVFFSRYTYSFQASNFEFCYGDAKIETMFHPLFAHLQNTEKIENPIVLKIFVSQNAYHLFVNENGIGSWAFNEDHILKGQVFMTLLNYAYAKKENDWLGVLHASAIGDDKNSVLFLGDSGNGKSTASAIALASGLSLIADDFVPVDTNAKVLTFPAAISVKKQALEFLSIRFPELLKAKEYELKAMNKTVRYLAPSFIKNSPRKIKALVFIQFTKDVDFELRKMDRHKAFQYLVVDAWLSPEEKNARFFLDWIAKIPIYSLRYSNNQKMVFAVKSLIS